mgnify:FL=1
MLDTNGCRGASDTFRLTVYPLPQPQLRLRDSARFCAGDSIALAANASYPQYRWNDLTAATDSLIFVRRSGRYALEVTDTNGCRNISDTLTITRLERPDTQLLVSGPLAFCADDSVVIEAAAGAFRYRWSDGVRGRRRTFRQGRSVRLFLQAPNGCRDTSRILQTTRYPLPFATVQSDTGRICRGDSTRIYIPSDPALTRIRWNGNQTSSGIYARSAGPWFAQLLDTNGCRGTTDTFLLTVDTLPRPQLTFSGPRAFCADTQLYVSTRRRYPQLDWSTGSRADTLVVRQSDTNGLTVIDGNGCRGAASPFTTRVLDLPRPLIVLDSNARFCAGDSLQLRTQKAWPRYQWSNGSASRATFAKNSGTLSVRVIDSNGCSNQASPISVQRLSRPQPQLSSSGDTSVCPDTDFFLAPDRAYAQYQWNDGRSRRRIALASEGLYYLRVVDEFGCRGFSDSLLFRYHPDFEPMVINEGPKRFCADRSVNLSVNGAYRQILWNNGATDSSIRVDQSGVYFYEARDSNGCLGQSPQRTLTVWPLPELTIKSGRSDQALAFCPGDSLVLEAESSRSDIQYRWSTGDGGTRTVIDTPGNYVLEGQTPQGCRSDTSVAAVQASLPTKPRLRARGSILLTDDVPAADYRWYLDGVALQGPANNQLQPPDTGYYQVAVINTLGCFQRSDSVYVAADRPFTVFPNPVEDGRLLVRSSLEAPAMEVYAELSQRQGGVVRTFLLSFERGSNTHLINVRGLSSGVYVLRIDYQGSVFTEKVFIR